MRRNGWHFKNLCSCGERTKYTLESSGLTLSLRSLAARTEISSAYSTALSLGPAQLHAQGFVLPEFIQYFGSYLRLSESAPALPQTVHLSRGCEDRR